MQWNLTSILIILFVFLFGYVIGLIEMHLRRRKKINELADALREERAKDASVENLPPSETPVPSISNLRLWTDSNRITKLELDNLPVDTPASATPEQRQRLGSLLNQLRPWIESVPAAAATSEVKPRPVDAAVLPVKKEKPDSEEVKPVPVLKSIVEQIDDVLQAVLLNSQFKDRDIHLAEGPVGIVLVKDGLKKYEGIDAVPDSKIRALIRQAVAEWEKSSH